MHVSFSTLIVMAPQSPRSFYPLATKVEFRKSRDSLKIRDSGVAPTHPSLLDGGREAIQAFIRGRAHTGPQGMVSCDRPSLTWCFFERSADALRTTRVFAYCSTKEHNAAGVVAADRNGLCLGASGTFSQAASGYVRAARDFSARLLETKSCEGLTIRIEAEGGTVTVTPQGETTVAVAMTGVRS